MNLGRRAFLAAGAALALAGPLGAQDRQARRGLVVSFSYFDMPGNNLANTRADGRLIGQTLRRLAFDDVTAIEDGHAEDALAQIGRFVDTLNAGDMAFVYFACHGIQIADENLIVMPGGQTFLSLRSLIDALRARTDMVIFLLDACRNNPLEDVPDAAQVSRALNAPGTARASFETVALDDLVSGNGAGPVSMLRPFSLQGSGVKIVFATDPTNVALDAASPASRNSPFAQSLGRRLLERRSLDDVVSLTTGDVRDATNGRQSPWAQGSIDRPIFLAGQPRERNPSRPPFQTPG